MFAAILVVALVVGWWVTGRFPVTLPGLQNASSTGSAASTTGTTGSTGVTTKHSTSGVMGVIASLGDGSTFYSYLTSTGVASSLTGKGPYTVFVPTNQAFGAASGSLQGLTAAQKKRLAQYHVVAGKSLDVDAVSGGTYAALSGDTLNFRVDLTYKEAFVNSGYAINEYKATNGIVYTISQVLIPPQTGSPSTGSTGTPVPH